MADCEGLDSILTKSPLADLTSVTLSNGDFCDSGVMESPTSALCQYSGRCNPFADDVLEEISFLPISDMARFCWVGLGSCVLGVCAFEKLLAGVT